VLSAHIEVVGNKAIDAFYVSGEAGALTASQKAKLRKSLGEVLGHKAGAKAA